jgi:hypothetical protein
MIPFLFATFGLGEGCSSRRVFGSFRLEGDKRHTSVCNPNNHKLTGLLPSGIRHFSSKPTI